jgi:aspartokinase-like uncharacterized kinase
MPRELKALLSVAEEVHRKCQPVAIVPGGSMFADAVLEAQKKAGFSDDVAHWMAVKAMEVYGVLIASHGSIGAEVETIESIKRAFEERLLPIVLPYKIVKQFDELPHTWDATSDSIAILIAGKLGCKRAFLAKLMSKALHCWEYQELNSETYNLIQWPIVDKYALKTAERYGVKVVIFNALKPEVLKKLVCNTSNMT